MSEWRKKVRTLAQSRADQEALHKWRIDNPAQIPFRYRWEHVQAVVGLALHLAAQLDADCDIVEAAAWLHDIRKMEPQHALAGAAEAYDILLGTDFPAHKIEAVVNAIRVHEGLTRPEGALPLAPVETAILWDADKLSKLGVQAIVFNMSAPYASGQSLEERRADLVRHVNGTLTRTVAGMNTLPAQKIAARRHADMINALAIWALEELEQTLSVETEDEGP
ncbi:HD domain-containing protein [bacterium]|nr:HD domain-containing protein [bacterium]